jgi:hypothetical protein
MLYETPVNSRAGPRGGIISMKLVKACIALAAFAAIFVIPSMASATSPTLFETTTATGTGAGTNDLVAVGTKLQAFNVAHAQTGLTTRFTAGALEVQCETATLTGELTKNSGGVIEGDITTAEFRGKKEQNPHGANCESNVGDVLPTPTHSSNPTHNGVGSLPWCVKASGLQDKVTVRGGKCSEASRPLFFTLDPIGFSCTYSRTEGLTATYTTHPSDAVATVDAGQVFTKVTGGAFCPAQGSLDMAFTLTTDTGKAKHAEEVALNIT